MEENQVFAEKQPKLWLAIMCAIGMGLVGCLLWGLLYYFNVIAWAAGFAIVFGAAWAYKKFNLKFDKKGYFIISAIAVVEVILTMFVTINISCLILLSKEGINISFFECFKLMFDVIGSDPATKTAVITDSILSLVCIGVGLLGFFFIEKRRNSKPKQSDIEKPLVLEEKKENLPSENNQNNQKLEQGEDKESS